MKVLIISLFCFVLTVGHQVLADDCEQAHLVVRDTKTQPAPSLKRNYDKHSKLWFTQESHLQEPDKVNYDTLVVASNSKGALVEILAQGHFREFAVDTKWVDKGRLLLNVEWGHILFCSYNVDIEKKTVSLVKNKKANE